MLGGKGSQSTPYEHWSPELEGSVLYCLTLSHVLQYYTIFYYTMLYYTISY